VNETIKDPILPLRAHLPLGLFVMSLCVGACDADEQSVGSPLSTDETPAAGSSSESTTHGSTGEDIGAGSFAETTSGGAELEPAGVEPDAVEPSDSTETAICQPLHEVFDYTLHDRDDVDVFVLDIGPDHGEEGEGTGYGGGWWFEVDVVNLEAEPPPVAPSGRLLSVTVYDDAMNEIGADLHGAIVSELQEGLYYAEVAFWEFAPAGVEAVRYSLVLDGHGHACE